MSSTIKSSLLQIRTVFTLYIERSRNVAEFERLMATECSAIGHDDDGMAMGLLCLAGRLRVVDHRTPMADAPCKLALPVMRIAAGNHYVGRA